MKKKKLSVLKTNIAAESWAHFIEINATGYNYLFLTPAAVFADKFFVTYELRHISSSVAYFHLTYIWFAGVFCSFFFPIYFIIAAFVNFKYPPQIGRANKFFIIAAHVLFILILIFPILAS